MYLRYGWKRELANRDSAKKPFSSEPIHTDVNIVSFRNGRYIDDSPAGRSQLFLF